MEKIKLECQYCHIVFYREKRNMSKKCDKYCSRECSNLGRSQKVKLNCNQCNKEIFKKKSHIKGNSFCSKSCAATFNNKLKRKSRRSKCEIYLFDLLLEKYPNIEVVANDRTILDGYEIDIYIPSLKLAIEWNGAVHFKPIFGYEKFANIQCRDKEKLEIATKKNINLIVIPDLISTKKYVEQIFNEITIIIDDLLANLSEEETIL